nr:uncharacterized protein LOC109186570 [Ipomoea batatas]
MDSKPIDIAKEITRVLYDVDKNIYSILVYETGHDPMKALQIISFWIWLEQIGFNVMRTFLLLPRTVINGLAEDAVACLECISHAQFLLSPAAREIVLTQRVLGKGLSLQYIHENREQAMCGVGKIFSEIYGKALTDMMAMPPPNRNSEQQRQNEMMMPPRTEVELMDRFGQLGLGGLSSQRNEFYNSPTNEYLAKLVLKPLSPDRRWKFIYEPLHHEVRLFSSKIPVTKFLNLQVGVGHSFQSHATGWKWKLTTCLGGDGVSRIRNKTSLGLCPGVDFRFGWRADYVLPEITGQVT